MKRKILIISSPLLALMTLILLNVFLIFNCPSVQKKLDIFSMESRYKNFENDTNYGAPDELKRYINSINLKADTRPVRFTLDDVMTAPLGKELLEPPDGIELIQEKLILPTRIKTGNLSLDRALFYLFRRGDLKSRNCIIIVPGGHVSNHYFSCLEDSFNELIRRDYDLLFYVPPFRLSRKNSSEDAGDDFILLNTKHNIRYMLMSVSELRSAISYLRKNGVNSIGLFGGSIGGSMALLVSLSEKVDHISVMEPVVDWTYTLVKNIHLHKLREKLNSAGFDNELLCRAYSLISPVAYNPEKNMRTIQVLYPRYDQYTPKQVMARFVKKWDIKYFNQYQRSHVTVLINNEMFKGYFSFLDTIAGP